MRGLSQVSNKVLLPDNKIDDPSESSRSFKERTEKKDSVRDFIIRCGCFAASGTGIFHKVDGIMKKKDYIQILGHHLKSAARWLKLVESQLLKNSWVFEQDNNPKHKSKLISMCVC